MTQPVQLPLPPIHFVDQTHALRAGFLLGTLMKAGVHVRPEMDDEGNYMPTIVIELPPLDELSPPVEVWVKVLPGPERKS